MKLAGVLALVCWAMPVAAQTLPVNYSETFETGNDVDLNQGFYVCQTNNPRDLLARLMDIKNPITRRAAAANAGCPFRMTNREGPKFKVLAEVGTICGNQQIVYDTNRGQRVASKICGSEGHQIIVERNGRQFVVLMLSSDVDFD